MASIAAEVIFENRTIDVGCHCFLPAKSRSKPHWSQRLPNFHIHFAESILTHQLTNVLANFHFIAPNQHHAQA